jgi:hypothetical protein
MGLALEGKTFSASVGVLIKSNARLQISLRFLGAMHGREQTCPPSIRFLQTLAATICGTQSLCKSGDGLLPVAQALFRQAQAVMSDTEVGLRRHTPRERADGLWKCALLQIRPPDISPGILWGSIQDILREGAQDVDRLRVALAMDERDSERVASLAKVWPQLQSVAGTTLGLFEATSIGTLPAEIEIDERGQMCCVGVFVVDLDGFEHVIEGLSHLSAVEPEILRQVVFGKASALVIANSTGRLRPGARHGGKRQRERCEGAELRRKGAALGAASTANAHGRQHWCRLRFRMPKL